MTDPVPAIEIGVDIGGTFTDIVCPAPGAPLRALKIPTTPGDPSRAVLQASAALSARFGIEPAAIGHFRHGTTGDPRKPSLPIRIAGEPTAVHAAIYDGFAMPVGMTLAGPAIVEQDDTAMLVEPAWRARVLENSTLLLERS